MTIHDETFDITIYENKQKMFAELKSKKGFTSISIWPDDLAEIVSKELNYGKFKKQITHRFEGSPSSSSCFDCEFIFEKSEIKLLARGQSDMSDYFDFFLE